MWYLYPEEFDKYTWNYENNFCFGSFQALSALEEDDWSCPLFLDLSREFRELEERGGSNFHFVKAYNSIDKELNNAEDPTDKLGGIFRKILRELIELVNTPPRSKIRDFRLDINNNLILYSTGLLEFYDNIKKRVNIRWLDNTIDKLHEYTKAKIQSDPSLSNLLILFEKEPQAIELEIVRREFDLNDPEDLASLERAQGYLDEYLNKQQDDELIIKNADSIHSVFSILVCGKDNLALVNLQLYGKDMEPINESYRTLTIPRDQAREIFGSYSKDGWASAELDNDVKLEMSSELLAENIWEFTEDVKSELNLKNMRVVMPKELPALESNDQWEMSFGKYFHREIVDIFDEIELVDISTEEMYDE
jgi:hypothetical protein